MSSTLFVLLLLVATSTSSLLEGQDDIDNDPRQAICKDSTLSYEQLQAAGCFFCQSGVHEGTLDGAAYQAIIPKKWNGILVVYAHGYSITVPAAEAFFSNPYWPTNATTAEEILLAQGYALAGSSYSVGGWAVNAGLQETNDLTRYFSSIFGLRCFPYKTILFGFSLGSLIALKAAEERYWWAPLYDGVIAGCSAGAGATRTVYLGLLFNIAYASGFYSNGVSGWQPSWGTPQAPSQELDFYTEVLPLLGGQLPYFFGEFEFQRLIAQLSIEDYYPQLVPPNPPVDISLFTDMFFSTEGLANINFMANGLATGNAGKSYSLTEYEIGYLYELGVDAVPLLEYLNTLQFTPEADAAKYIAEFDYTGRITVPVLTMHTQNDGLLPAMGDVAYRQTVETARRLDRLYQVYTSGSGHCNFSQDQVVKAVAAMTKWVTRGEKPNPNDFPEAEGFMPQDYSPGPWPY